MLRVKVEISCCQKNTVWTPKRILVRNNLLCQCFCFLSEVFHHYGKVLILTLQWSIDFVLKECAQLRC